MFKVGKQIGEKIYYFEFGGIEKKEYYKNDKLDGWVTNYSKEGLITTQELYKNGIIVNSN